MFGKTFLPSCVAEIEEEVEVDDPVLIDIVTELVDTMAVEPVCTSPIPAHRRESHMTVSSIQIVTPSSSFYDDVPDTPSESKRFHG